MENRRVPNVTFKTRTGDEEAVGGCNFIGGTWKDLTSDHYFKGKKVVLFSLPGAFTPTCSSQQLPGYEEKYDELKALGIDEVYCISVNDAFVMNCWFRDQSIKNVKPIADGNGHFTTGMDMIVNKEHLGFAHRSWRYSAVINDGVVERMFVEPGKNNTGDDMDPFEVSDVDTMLSYLKGEPTNRLEQQATLSDNAVAPE